MFVLTDDATGGVYAVKDDSDGRQVVTMFVDKDDAVRYYSLLEANGFARALTVTEVESDVVKDNCAMHGYMFTIITPDDIIVPPPEEDLEDIPKA
jgi:hypothetical protein|tara:strand:- start:4675 stop:4959 length:285 start_codon:yes stop_codon:yes gene_type:complete